MSNETDVERGPVDATVGPHAITAGSCSCGEPINKIYEPERPILLASGVRYQYPRGSKYDTHDRYCIFRCERCGQVVIDTWRPNAQRSPGAERSGASPCSTASEGQ
jgi:hypothetical protein